MRFPDRRHVRVKRSRSRRDIPDRDLVRAPGFMRSHRAFSFGRNHEHVIHRVADTIDIERRRRILGPFVHAMVGCRRPRRGGRLFRIASVSADACGNASCASSRNVLGVCEAERIAGAQPDGQGSGRDPAQSGRGIALARHPWSGDEWDERARGPRRGIEKTGPVMPPGPVLARSVRPRLHAPSTRRREPWSMQRKACLHANSFG
ncbi:MAG: hypothetical protein JWQ00_1383 [Noviherbaspirillum sp.]|nr:hypothetical protein [Noviherbaspirillum sp.]